MRLTSKKAYALKSGRWCRWGSLWGEEGASCCSHWPFRLLLWRSFCHLENFEMHFQHWASARANTVVLMFCWGTNKKWHFAAFSAAIHLHCTALIYFQVSKVELRWTVQCSGLQSGVELPLRDFLDVVFVTLLLFMSFWPYYLHNASRKKFRVIFIVLKPYAVLDIS